MEFDDEVSYVTTLRERTTLRCERKVSEGDHRGREHKERERIMEKTDIQSIELGKETTLTMPMPLKTTTLAASEEPPETEQSPSPLLGKFVVRNRQMGKVSLREQGTFWHRLTKRCAVWWTAWLKQHHHHQQQQPVPRATPIIGSGELEDMVFSPHTNRPLIADMPSFESLTELALGSGPFPHRPSISQLLQNFTKIEPSSASLQLRKSASTPTFSSPKLRSSLRRRTATGLHVHFSPQSGGDIHASPLPHLSANIVPSFTTSYLHIINSCDSFFLANSPQSV